jgi:hypothetical protein
MDRVGIEPTTSAMPATYYLRVATERKSILSKFHPVHHLASLFFKTSFNGANLDSRNSSSKTQEGSSISCLSRAVYAYSFR